MDSVSLFFVSKQEKEYKEALEAFNDKSREKAQLVAKLMEVTGFYDKSKNPFLFFFIRF